jgi:hypothetical protein
MAQPTCSIEEFTRTTFDYVVCGGGTAGLVVASRLSENPDVTVGVIEAGKYRIGDPLVDTPAAFSQMFENPEYDWCMYTSPQVCCTRLPPPIAFIHGLRVFRKVTMAKDIISRGASCSVGRAASII